MLAASLFLVWTTCSLEAVQNRVREARLLGSPVRLYPVPTNCLFTYLRERRYFNQRRLVGASVPSPYILSHT